MFISNSSAKARNFIHSKLSSYGIDVPFDSVLTLHD
jgi:ribonucleotide monophosphatase NagD (HAD superfamily)